MARTSARRQELMKAAVSVFSRYGYHETGVREIAEEAHVAVGTVYLYFSGKTDLFVSLIDMLYGRVMEAVLANRRQSGNAVTKLEESLEAVVKVLLHDRDLARVVLIKSIGSEPMLEDHLWHVHQTFANLLVEELQECGLTPATAQVGAWAWVGALSEIFGLWARQPALDLEAMANEVRVIFWKGWGLG
ncbi:MAG: TetR/AcrR family transcriptional regulator [Firmicutes bacterium]|nr:TetR/AcrR family transcriptional regulator [Bacillota bacterium]MCL5065981.1 TetR/AcrR family transcriptional regulator [Bacillota bacterium]